MKILFSNAMKNQSYKRAVRIMIIQTWEEKNISIFMFEVEVCNEHDPAGQPR